MTTKDDRPSFTVENADIIYRNFSGLKTKFNAEGQRNFCVVLDEKVADQMKADGWNVRTREPREEGDDTLNYIQVKVNFDSARPPRVILVSSAGQTPLNVETISTLDYVDIATVDVQAVAYSWELRGETGITAYLKKLYVVIEEDELDLKYSGFNRS